MNTMLYEIARVSCIENGLDPNRNIGIGNRKNVDVALILVSNILKAALKAGYPHKTISEICEPESKDGFVDYLF